MCHPHAQILGHRVCSLQEHYHNFNVFDALGSFAEVLYCNTTQRWYF